MPKPGTLLFTTRLLKNSVCRLLKKIAEAREKDGVLEYWSIGVLVLTAPSITPSLQYSSLYQEAIEHTLSTMLRAIGI